MMMTKIGYNWFPFFTGTETDSKQQYSYCYQIIRPKALVFIISHEKEDDVFFGEQSISFEIPKLQTNFKKGQTENY